MLAFKKINNKLIWYIFDAGENYLCSTKFINKRWNERTAAVKFHTLCLHYQIPAIETITRPNYKVG